MQALLVELHFTARRHCRFCLTSLCQSLFKICNQFEDTVFGLASALLSFIPVRDRATQINSLDLLDKSSNNLKVFVPDRSDPDKVDIDATDDITTGNARMLLCKFFIADSRDNELILARLAPINMIVSVEKGPIADHQRHLVPLVHNLKVAICVDLGDLNFLVISRQNLHLVLEEGNELVWHDVLHLDFTDIESSAIAFPHLVMHYGGMIVIRRHYWNLALPLEQVGGLVE